MREVGDFIAGGTDWQEYCRNWATTTHQPFKIHNIGKEHLLFCQQLAMLYNYEYVVKDSVAHFAPVEFN